jgi:DNA replication protein DnaC
MKKKQKEQTAKQSLFGAKRETREDLEQLLKLLRLKKVCSVLDRELARAEKTEPSYTEFLARLLREQYLYQQECAMLYRVREARLPEQWTLETFPFDRQPGVTKSTIMQLAELDFLARGTNLVFIGDPGVGKTGLATGLVLKALENGHKCQFVKAQNLFDEMYASLADRSTTKLLHRLSRVALLCIDEMGYLNLRPEQSNIFFKLMEERYGKRSTIITTNLDYDDWYGFLGNKAMVSALLSRLRHHCQTIRINGPTLRPPQD